MLLDVVWVGLAHATGATNEEAPKAWAIINVGMLVFLIAFWNFANESLPRYVLLLTASMIRTALDYYSVRKYYFPGLR